MWQGWLNAILGILVLIGGFYVPDMSLKVFFVVMGILQFIFGVWGGMAK